MYWIKSYQLPNIWGLVSFAQAQNSCQNRCFVRSRLFRTKWTVNGFPAEVCWEGSRNPLCFSPPWQGWSFHLCRTYIQFLYLYLYLIHYCWQHQALGVYIHTNISTGIHYVHNLLEGVNVLCQNKCCRERRGQLMCVLPKFKKSWPRFVTAYVRYYSAFTSRVIYKHNGYIQDTYSYLLWVEAISFLYNIIVNKATFNCYILFKEK